MSLGRRRSLPGRIARFSVRHPILGLVISLGACFVAALGGLQVRLETQITALLPHGHPSLDRFTLVQDEFGSSDLLGIALELPDGYDEQTQEAARALIRRMGDIMQGWRYHHGEEHDDMVLWVEGIPDPVMDQAFEDLVVANTWLFLDDEGLELMTRRLRPRRVAVSLERPSPSIPAQLQDRDPVGVWTDCYLPWWTEQLDDSLPVKREGDYLRSRDEQFYLLLGQARHPASHSHFTMAVAKEIEAMLATVEPEAEAAGITLWSMGPYSVAARDYRNAKLGAWVSMASSLIGVLALFAIAYRSWRLPVLIAVSLMPAVSAALGLAALISGGSLTLIVTAFAAILIGLGVDFVIHLYNGYMLAIRRLRGDRPLPDTRERRRRWRAIAAVRAVDGVGGGIIAAGITSIGTFLILLLSHYRGLSELGAVCGTGLAIILVQLTIAVPAWLTLFGTLTGKPSQLMAPLARSVCRRPRIWAAGLMSLLIAAGAFLAMQPQLVVYDRDPRNLRPKDDELFIKQISLSFRLGLLTGGHQVLIRGKNAETVLEGAHSYLEKLGAYMEESPVTIAEDIDLDALRAGKQIDELALEGLQLRTPEQQAGRRCLYTEAGVLLFEGYGDGTLRNVHSIPQQPPSGQRISAGSAAVIAPLVHDLRHPLRFFAPPSRQREVMQRLQGDIDWPGLQELEEETPASLKQRRARFFEDLQEIEGRVAKQQILLPQDLIGTPLEPIVRNAFVEREGECLLRIPLHLNHRTGQSGFGEMQEVLGLDPSGAWRPIPGTSADIGTAGSPSITWVLQEILSQDFSRLTLWALGVTLLLLMLTMRNLGDTALALITLIGGVTVGLASMHALGMRWNMMNIAVLPLVIGIGIDNGIHFLHALRRSRHVERGVERTMTEIGHPILITALTSIIGFGSLGLNAYRGVQSVGLTAAVGIAACMVVALIGLPLIALALRRHNNKGD